MSDNSQQRQARRSECGPSESESNLASATTVDMPGNSKRGPMRNYATVVKSVYEAGMDLPIDVPTNANTKVSVTICQPMAQLFPRDHHPSWRCRAGRSGPAHLGTRKFIMPFPEGATEKERTYTH